MSRRDCSRCEPREFSVVLQTYLHTKSVLHLHLSRKRDKATQNSCATYAFHRAPYSSYLLSRKADGRSYTTRFATDIFICWSAVVYYPWGLAAILDDGNSSVRLPCAAVIGWSPIRHVAYCHGITNLLYKRLMWS